jgi:hypothetical protein
MAIAIPLAVLADSANVSQEGKLNLLGIFENIQARQFPVTHPSLALVFIITGDSGDVGSPHKLKVDFVNADGKSFLKVEGDIQFQKAPSGAKPRANQIININGLPIEKPGRYEFKIIINGEERTSVPVDVLQVGAPSKKSK